MFSQEIKKMPTGLSTLDPVFNGGIPPGTLLLLIGDIGSGKNEFAFTSLINLTLFMEKGNQNPGILLPKEIHYISVTKIKEDIIQEISQSFHPDLLEQIDKVIFDDISDIYFDSSLVPINWYSEQTDILQRMEARRKIHESILSNLSIVLNDVTGESLVILDSLTDLAAQYSSPSQWPHFTAYLRGMQRIAKKWRTSFYLILTKGVLSPSQETEVADVVDAVIHFRWEESSSAKRQRVLYIEKFRGVMIHLEERELVKFAVKITSGRGFEVNNIRLII